MKLLKFLLLAAFTAGAAAQDVEVLDMTNFRHYRYDERALEVDKKIDVRIVSTGAVDRWNDRMIAYGWILDSKTRETVWELSADNSERRSGRYNRQANETIELSPGIYEVYYAVSFGGFGGRDYQDFGDFLDDLFSGFSKGSKYDRYADDWGITLSVDAGKEKHIRKVPMEDAAEAVFQLCPMNDDEYEKQGFSLARETDLRIYAIGEGDDGEMYDYGWIVDAQTGETVWEMDYRDTDWAGGADKNRIIDEEFTFEQGDYIISFVTDGSHSYEKWNMMPPKDPRFWGITLLSTDDRENVGSRIRSFTPEKPKNLIVNITRAGNYFFEQAEINVTHEVTLRIRCLGEMSGSRNFVDEGYILDTETGERVWEMTRRNTRHAGGASKNRMFDGLVTLDPGIYRVCYNTDDSHSYRKWNSSPPYEPAAWGIVVWGGPDFRNDWVEVYSEKDDPDVLVNLIRAFDNDKLRGKFTLERDSRVRIYALGERDGSDLCDYGWIEDRDGRTVWEMDPRDCEHAGGARKNCMINESIRLEAGDYYVFYRTDGSHSFEKWNDSPPWDPSHWGITVKLAGNR